MTESTIYSYELAYEKYDLGAKARRIFDYPTARDLYLAAEEILASLDSKAESSLVDLKAKNLNVLGLVRSQLGEYPNAISNLEEALQLRQALGDNQLEEVYILNNLGIVTESQKNLVKAREHYQQAKDLLEPLDHGREDIRIAKATILNNLALAKTALEDYSGVSELLVEALAHFEVLQDQQGIGQTLHNMGYTEYKALSSLSDLANNNSRPSDKFMAIRGYYIEALEKRQISNDILGKARTLNSLGCLYAEYVRVTGKNKNNFLKKAEENLNIARELFADLQNPVGQDLVEHSFEIVTHARRRLRVGRWFGWLIGEIKDEIG